MRGELQIKEIQSTLRAKFLTSRVLRPGCICVLGFYDTYQNHKLTYDIKFTSVIFFCMYLSDSKQYHVQ